MPKCFIDPGSKLNVSSSSTSAHHCSFKTWLSLNKRGEKEPLVWFEQHTEMTRWIFFIFPLSLESHVKKKKLKKIDSIWTKFNPFLTLLQSNFPICSVCCRTYLGLPGLPIAMWGARWVWWEFPADQGKIQFLFYQGLSSSPYSSLRTENFQLIDSATELAV